MAGKDAWEVGQAAGYAIKSSGDQTFFRPARCFRGRALTLQSDRSFQKDGDLDERNCLLGITAISWHTYILYPVLDLALAHLRSGKWVCCPSRETN